MTDKPANKATIYAPLVGILSWLVPGLGHLFLGDRVRGFTLMATITLTFWTGIAIGGVRDTIDSSQRRLWYTAQICSGGHTLLASAWGAGVRRSTTEQDRMASPTHWGSIDIGVHYTGIAGLLNILVILDAVGRTENKFGAHGPAKSKDTRKDGDP
ncbi:MAG: DUF6677 family protein [Phycisphaerae bacterium]